MRSANNSPTGPIAMHDSVLRWRTLACLYGAGSAIGAASLLLPHSSQANTTALWANTGLALVTAVTVGLLARVLPLWLNHVCLAGGTLIVTRAIYDSGDAESYYAIWYVWVALYAFSFCGRRAACLHTSLVGLSYAAVLVAKSADSAAGRWLTTIGTMVIAAVFVDALVRALRRHAAAAELSARQLDAAARTDDLTGLPNRRSWDQDLARTIAHARRFEIDVCVAILDLDGFKELNDQYGHHAGDAMLSSAAIVWSAELRDVDTLARWGGDEFAVLLPGCDLEAAGEAIERVRAVTPLGTTCSAGLVCWNGVEDVTALMARADVALYDAKRGGRNQLAVEPAAGVPVA
jgi:diguanylate cyclase (GGDEF)-like protein